MSVVWRATDEVLRRPVAVKVLAGRFVTDAAARLRLQAEARAAARLTHPNVASVYDYGESHSESGHLVPFVVMEMLSGPTLSRRLADGPLPPTDALKVCAEVASGLAAAHAAALVHRDVKPANVMLTPTGAKVVDFGIAAAAGPRDDVDPYSDLFGTPAYLAPERLVGGDVVPASDVYALGLLLHGALLGRLPWEAETTTQMLAAHVYVEPTPLPPIDGVPALVIGLARRCLAKNPADRPTASEVASELASAASTAATATAGPPAPAPGPRAGPALAVRPAGTGSLVDPGSDATTAAVRAQRSGRRRVVLFATAGAVAIIAIAAVMLIIEPTVKDAPVAEADVTHSAPAGGSAGDAKDPSAAPTTPAPTWAGRGPASTTAAPIATETGGATASPRTTAPTRPAETATVTATPVVAKQRTLTSAGGTALAECVGSTAEVLSSEPADGYTVRRVVPGPAPTVSVTFAGPKTVHMRIRCNANGVPYLV
ncbi:protein kinase [Micromonospora sp. CPCC 205371]|nr:protein kinase [Micromonospora sp. CPCC 205371]